LLEHPVDILICGHSHILKIIYDPSFDVLFLNPGAAGKYGFHAVRTLLRFQLDNGNITNMELVELEKR
jgi:uncharacterized protein